jgi:hypothetical protein
MKLIRRFLTIGMIIVGTCSCSTLQNFIAAPTNLETITALKEILNSSALRTLTSLATASDSGLIGLLPEEVRPVVATLRTLGLGSQLDQLDQKVTDVSKIALKESSGLMEDAISQVRFEDAVAVVTGGENAATTVLKNAMYGAVSQRYGDRLDTELSKVDETKHWDTAISAYNLFAKNKIEGRLSDFIAKRAVDAIFVGMGKEEAVIRKNPASLDKEVVTRVFDYYKNNKG